MPGVIDIKRRIKSIHSMRKITRAMQLVSAAKMGKAQTATLKSRTYAALAWELITNLTPPVVIPSESDEPRNPLTNDKSTGDPSDAIGMTSNKLLATYPQAKKTGIILLTTNKGLVGSLNLNLASKLEEVDKDSEVLSELIVYGKKGKHLAIILNKHIAADFPKIDKTASLDEIYPIAQLVTKLYETGQYRQILIIYNHFVSTLVQKATIKQLLPFVSSFSDSHPHPTSPIKGEEPSRVPLPGREGLGEGGLSTNFDYLFEPDPKEVLDHLLPRIIESQIYQAILENDASEHSARMIMMKNATDAAGDLITDLTLTYNQIRQNKITTELAEITAGKIALE